MSENTNPTSFKEQKMKTVTTKSSFTKKTSQGNEMKIDINIEVQGEYNPEEIASEMEAMTNALSEQKQMPQYETLASNTPQQSEPMPIHTKGSNNEKKASDQQLKMVRGIMLRKKLTEDFIYRQYQVSSLADLTHSQVNDIDKRFNSDYKKDSQFF